MKKIEDVSTFSKLAEGADFFLSESFYYIEKSMIDELSSIIFAQKLDSIEPTKSDRELEKKITITSNTVELLQNDVDIPLTEETLNLISEAWQQAQIEAGMLVDQKHNFQHKHVINSINLIGHFNNFGFFIETLVNRHLLFLKLTNEINSFCYARISESRIMERIIYIFKNDLNNNKIHINEIVNLFSLRNKTVHYTPKNAIALNSKLSEILQIWNQSLKLISIIEIKENIIDSNFTENLKNHINSFKEKWI